MACELPAIGSRTGGIPEIIQDGLTGSLTPPGDAQALAQAIIQMMEDEAGRRRMGAAGREFVLEHFAWEKCVAQMDELYRQVLSHAAGEAGGL
jgi:glycosyltransferase involved in cell wall biosynthesis